MARCLNELLTILPVVLESTFLETEAKVDENFLGLSSSWRAFAKTNCHLPTLCEVADKHMNLPRHSLWWIVISFALTSCTSTILKIYPPTSDDSGFLRLAEVMHLATRQEIVSVGILYDQLLASGISDADLRDGSLAVGRVYCCEGPLEKGGALWIYVPNPEIIEVGNIVEVRMGRQPATNDTGVINTLERFRHKRISEAPCRWVPERQGLWMRILYCNWMENEGWTERGGLYKTWVKPVSSMSNR